MTNFMTSVIHFLFCVFFCRLVAILGLFMSFSSNSSRDCLRAVSLIYHTFLS